MRISYWSSDVCSSDLKFRLLAKRVTDQLTRIFIANGNPGEIPQLVRPIATQPVRCIVIAETCRIRDKFFGPQSRTIKDRRSEEHTSELQSLMRISYAVFCLKKKKKKQNKL